MERSDEKVGGSLRQFVPYLVIILLEVIIYFPFLMTFFFQDDIGWLWLLPWSPSEIIYSVVRADSLRPVPALIFGPWYWIVDFRPDWIYALSIAFHISNTILVYRLIITLLDCDVLSAFAGAAYFGLSVIAPWGIYFGNICVSICCFFSLLCVSSFIRYDQQNTGKRELYKSMFFLVMAVFSYETAIGIPLFLLLYCILHRRREFVDSVRVIVPLLAVSICCLLTIVSFKLSNYFFYFSTNTSPGADLSNAITKFLPEKIAFVGWMVAWLNLGIGLPLLWARIALNVLTCSVFLGVAVLCIQLLRRRNWLPILILSWIVLSIWPALIIRMGTPHRCYIPSAGLAILVAAFAAWMRTFPSEKGTAGECEYAPDPWPVRIWSTKFGTVATVAMILAFVLTSCLNMDRLMNYGGIGPRGKATKDFLSSFVRENPCLPKGATVYVITDQQGLRGETEDGRLLNVYYKDRTIKVYFRSKPVNIPADAGVIQFHYKP